MFVLQTGNYREQAARWPSEGQHILAHFDNRSIIVYQAYRSSVAHYAVTNQTFGGDHFSYGRMSWIKPNFLWMMYRSGWASKPDQEAILALRIRRSFFDELLSRAVPSTFHPTDDRSKESWARAVNESDVRLQWDPDHHPSGAKLQRRAIQLGLRGKALKRFGTEELIEVLDITGFVREQRMLVSDLRELRTPAESVYRPADETAARNVRLSSWPPAEHPRPALSANSAGGRTYSS